MSPAGRQARLTTNAATARATLAISGKMRAIRKAADPGSIRRANFFGQSRLRPEAMAGEDMSALRQSSLRRWKVGNPPDAADRFEA
jgi:hypothetical protein